MGERREEGKKIKQKGGGGRMREEGRREKG